MKFAALILVSLSCLCAWGGDATYHLIRLKHLSDDDYIFQVDFISTKSDPGSKPLTIKEVENMLPKDHTRTIPEFAEIKKDHTNWYVDSQKYLLKKGFTSTYSSRNDKLERGFTGEITNVNNEDKHVSLKFKVTKAWPPLPDNDDDKTIIYHECNIETNITMRIGEVLIMGTVYDGTFPKNLP